MNAITAAGHDRIVRLHSPGAATPGLRALIEASEQGIQTSVDLLGANKPSLAPDFIQMLKESGLIDEHGQAVLADEHSGAVEKLSNIKLRLRELDDGVDASTTDVGAVRQEAWEKIESTVETLNGVLAAAPPPATGEKYLSAAVEIKLQSAVHAAVKEVDGHIKEADAKIRQHADVIGGQNFPQAPARGRGETTAPPGHAPIGLPPTPGPMNFAQARSKPHRPAGLGPTSRGRGGYDSGYTDQLGATTSDPNGRRKLSRQELEVHIGKALDALGITDPVARANWTRGYLVLIARESGGDTGAINLVDSNAAAGRPSQGLTQTIPSTFRSYHVAGTSSAITDPTANIAASMNYVMQRYHVARDGSNLTANVQQTDATRPPRGY